jgi:exonuclease VII small subunit
MLGGMEFGGVLNEADTEVRRLRAKIGQLDEQVAEYQRIVNAQRHLDELLAEREQVAAEINSLIDAQRVPLAP